MVTETLELKGHILDSLILPKVLDEILEREGRFEILEMSVGHRAADMSSVRLRVEAPEPEKLEAILTRLREQGAETLVWLASGADATSGGYYSDKKLTEPKPPAQDPAAARRLWETCERQTTLPK